jgi:ATP-dependent Clp protease protease subunit
MAKQETPPFVKIEDKIEASILQARRIFLSDPVNHESATDIIKKLWHLELEDPGKTILLVINSPGGSVSDGFAIWDQIKMITSPVTTLVTGLAASMGSVLSLASAPKKCFATPNARFMIHQPLIGGYVQGQATDLEIQARELLKTRDKLVELYCTKTGKSADEIEKAIDRDTWLSAKEAKDFGLIDKIVTSFKDL